MSVAIMVPTRYHLPMDVNVKGLDPSVVARLAEQAEAEGLSAQEWMRQALRRTAALLTPHELQARVADRTPISRERFTATMQAVTARRAAGGATRTPDTRRDVRHRGS